MSTTSELSTLDDPVFRRELLTIASFLAGYGTTTRTGYATDLRIFADWCREHGLDLFEVQRSHLQLFARSMEAQGLMPSTVARRLSALASFYRYCEATSNGTQQSKSAGPRSTTNHGHSD